MMEASAVEIRLRNHEARLDANHDSLAKLRDTSATHETKIQVITTELRETREDLSEIRRELTWVKRGLWAAAGSFLMFFVAAFSLLLSLSGHG
jgi:septal ring factor EnvC (AmiA/AmiB activator)